MQFRSSKNGILSDKFWTKMRNIWDIKAIFMEFWWAVSHKKEWGHLLERILYTSRYSISQELLQLLDEFSFSYLFLLFFWQASPVSVWAFEGAELHHTKQNMSCQAGSMFEPNSDYIWERHVLKLLADGQVVFSEFFNFLHYQPDGIDSNEWNGIEVPIWKTVFITCVCYLYKLKPKLFLKLVNLVLVMRPLTDHVYFVGIV